MKKVENLCSSALLKPFFGGEPVNSFTFVYSYMRSVTKVQAESDTFILSRLNFLVNRLFNIGSQALHAKSKWG